MEMREDYQALMEKQLNEWKAQSESIEAWAARMEMQTMPRHDKDIELLHAKQEKAWVNFHCLKHANEGAWEQFRTSMDKAWEELQDAAEITTAQFRH
jgi:hypothetical protein